jgi:anti-sigma B factor antagonist
MTAQSERTGKPRAEGKGLRITPQTVEGRPGALVVHVDGYVDAYNAGYFQREVETALDGGILGLVLDLTRVTYVSSLGVAALIEVQRKLRSAHREMIVAGTAKGVYVIFELLGLTAFFRFVPSVEAGLLCLSPSPVGSVFPKLDRCPVCAAALRFHGQGRVRCPRCRSCLAVDAAGAVRVG